LIIIDIGKDFSRTPGARHKSDGPFSGEEFREKFLEKHFEDKNDSSPLRIILDGTEGYATSFLEEAFGGLARKYTKKRCKKRLDFVSEDKLLIDEINDYIEHSCQ